MSSRAWRSTAGPRCAPGPPCAPAGRPGPRARGPRCGGRATLKALADLALDLHGRRPAWSATRRLAPAVPHRAVDLDPRRHRRGAAQHPRRTRARPAARAPPRQGRAVQPDPTREVARLVDADDRPHAFAGRGHATDRRVGGLEPQRALDADHVTEIGVDGAAVAHDDDPPRRAGEAADHVLDRFDDPRRDTSPDRRPRSRPTVPRSWRTSVRPEAFATLRWGCSRAIPRPTPRRRRRSRARARMPHSPVRRSRWRARAGWSPDGRRPRRPATSARRAACSRPRGVRWGSAGRSPPSTRIGSAWRTSTSSTNC